MNDNVWTRDEINSPCVKICVMHPTERLCTGCLRSIEEITRWSAMTPGERAEILRDLPARAPRLARRRGGRKGRIQATKQD